MNNDFLTDDYDMDGMPNRNLTFGYATLMWDDTKKAWALPGGLLTKSRMQADKVVRKLNDSIRKHDGFANWRDNQCI